MEETDKTILWWRLLATIAAINIVLWVWSYAKIDSINSYQQAHLVLSGIYVLVCAYRSVLPRIDLERYCLVDTQLSSIFLGRSAATVAEVCFATQLALVLHELGGQAGVAGAQRLAFAVVPILTLAQIFCWYSVITLNHLGHAIEESLWASTLALVGIALATIGYYSSGATATIAILGAVASAGYVLFMVTIDIPMYLQRWRQSQTTKQTFLSVGDGIKDAWQRRVVTRDWAIWKAEVAWLTGYFSIAVWISIALAHLPRP